LRDFLSVISISPNNIGRTQTEADKHPGIIQVKEFEALRDLEGNEAPWATVLRPSYLRLQPSRSVPERFTDRCLRRCAGVESDISMRVVESPAAL